MPTFTVYALVSPKVPECFRYIGFTGVDTRKRLYDHISAAKFAGRQLSTTDGKPRLTPVMEWLETLRAKSLRPVLVELETFEEVEEAAQAEERLIAQYRKERKHRLLNVQRFDTRPCRIGTRYPVSMQKRKELGYPHPELPAKHPLNLMRYIELRPPSHCKSRPKGKVPNPGQAARMVHSRTRKGYPHPELAVIHPLNLLHHYHLKLQKAELIHLTDVVP